MKTVYHKCLFGPLKFADLFEDVYRMKSHKSKPEKGESSEQYIERLKIYSRTLGGVAKAEKLYNALLDVLRSSSSTCENAPKPYRTWSVCRMLLITHDCQLIPVTKPQIRIRRRIRRTRPKELLAAKPSDTQVVH